MIDLFGEVEFKPLKRFHQTISKYYITNTGEIYSSHSGKFLKQQLSASHNQYLMVKVNVPIDQFDYPYAQNRRQKSTCRIPIVVHKAVIESWKPVDEYPPIPQEDWDKCPESAKQWIRDTAIVDHKDDDPSNNHVDNLQWVIPKDNEPNRKKRDQSS